VAVQKKPPAASRPKTKEEDKAQVSLWERLERPAPAARPVLTAHRIGTVAVEIADAEGIDAVTMRRIASEMGIAPMAAYRYLSGKDEVLEVMVDLVYGDMEMPDDTKGWRETMRALAVHTRVLVLKHPWVAQFSSPSSVLALTPNRLAVAERSLAALSGLGLDADSMMSVFNTINAYVHGMLHSEIAWQRLMQAEGCLTPELTPHLTWLLDTGRFPTFRHCTFDSPRRGDAPWQFETGLECVLDGIAARMCI
jgi:AcrR family transcriptional regulator